MLIRSILLFHLCVLSWSLSAQKYDVVDFQNLSEKIHLKGEISYFVNFWATWCRPCAQELPFILEWRDQVQDSVKLIFVSLDFEKHWVLHKSEKLGRQSNILDICLHKLK